MQKNGIGQN